MWRYSKKEAIYKPGKVFSSDCKAADILILGFLDSITVKSKYLLLKPLSLWYFVIAAWAKTIIKCFLHLSYYKNVYPVYDIMIFIDTLPDMIDVIINDTINKLPVWDVLWYHMNIEME